MFELDALSDDSMMLYLGQGDGCRFYTDVEIEQFRAQLREGSRLAAEVVQRHGVTMHPRIAAALAKSLPET